MAEDSIQHYCGLGLLADGSRPSKPCLYWQQFFVRHDVGSTDDLPDGRVMLGLIGTDAQKDKALALLHTLRLLGMQREVEDEFQYFFLLFPDPITNENLDLFASEVMPHFK